MVLGTVCVSSVLVGVGSSRDVMLYSNKCRAESRDGQMTRPMD